LSPVSALGKTQVHQEETRIGKDQSHEQTIDAHVELVLKEVACWHPDRQVADDVEQND
jgi:hypothetical protein